MQSLDQIKQLYSLIDDPFVLDCNLDVSSLYNYLKSNYHTSYNANQRLVFIHQGDTYDLFGTEIGHCVAYLQKFLDELDITNCFVHIASGNKQIAQELYNAQQKFSNDSTSIEYTIVDTKFDKQIKKRDSFCLRAWKHLYVDTQANLRLCCMTDQAHVLGSIKNSSVHDVVNSESFCKVRTAMLKGETIESCKTCYDKEDIGQKSQRQVFNEKWHHLIKDAKAKTNIDGSILEYSPVTTHVAMNNICNLKCRTCSGLSSSKLALEEKNLLDYTTNYDGMLKHKEKQNVVDNIIDTVQQTHKINFAGGEPLLQDEHYQILDYLLKNNMDHIELKYNTNGTVLQHKKYNVCQIWNQFKNVRVRFSLDGMGNVFNYIRHGAHWDEVENNFIKVKNFCPNINLGVNSVVSFLSIESIMLLQKQWHTRGICDISKFNLDYMYENNDFYSLQTLPIHHKDKIASKIDQHCEWLKQQKSSLVTDWQNMKDYMFAKDLTHVLNLLYKDLTLRDRYRKENFNKVFPQFVDIFDNL